jgi:hypothetical protein
LSLINGSQAQWQVVKSTSVRGRKKREAEQHMDLSDGAFLHRASQPIMEVSMILIFFATVIDLPELFVWGAREKPRQASLTRTRKACVWEHL